MKKVLMLLMVMSFISVIPMVMAESATQNVAVNVNENIIFAQLADLNFGSLTPSASPQSGPNVTFNAVGSNEDLTLTSNVPSGLFEGISFINGSTITPINNFTISLPMSAQTKTLGTQILIPVGTPKGLKSGTITYTIMGPAPAPVCGNNIIEGTEVCDGTNIGTQTCASNPDTTKMVGLPTCSSCTGFDYSSCTAV